MKILALKETRLNKRDQKIIYKMDNYHFSDRFKNNMRSYFRMLRDVYNKNRSLKSEWEFDSEH